MQYFTIINKSIGYIVLGWNKDFYFLKKIFTLSLVWKKYDAQEKYVPQDQIQVSIFLHPDNECIKIELFVIFIIFL